jgi:hypothetical protein
MFVMNLLMMMLLLLPKMKMMPTTIPMTKMKVIKMMLRVMVMMI